jgi:hypothetical protein
VCAILWANLKQVNFIAGKASFAPGQEKLPRKLLFQLGVLRFGGDEDGDVWVGVFPEREEILVSGECLGAIAPQRIGGARPR